MRVLGEWLLVPMIKLGPKGSIGLWQGRPMRVPAPRVRAIETTGAGDAFDAGFLWAFLRGEPLARCLSAGNICRAYSTRAAGGTGAFPRRRKVLALLREKEAPR